MTLQLWQCFWFSSKIQLWLVVVLFENLMLLTFHFRFSCGLRTFLSKHVLAGCSLRWVWRPSLQGQHTHHLPRLDLLHFHQDGKTSCPPHLLFLLHARLTQQLSFFKPPFFFVYGLQKNDKTARELIEVPVKDLTFDQLQLLKVKDKININLQMQAWVARQCYFAASVSSAESQWACSL